MRNVFWRFYLMVALFFLASSLVIGAIYKQVLNRNNQLYLSDIFKTTLYLIEDELIDVPQHSWPKAIKKLGNKISVHIDINLLGTYVLSPENQRALLKGDIIMLKDSGLFLQRIPGSQYMIVLGPIDYLNSVRSLQWVDGVMFVALCLSLAIPAFFWLRPLWRQLQELSTASKSLGAGNFTARVDLPDTSPLKNLASTFNSMAYGIKQLMDDRKWMIDAISHDLHTPMARLRYRIEALRAHMLDANQEALLSPMVKDLDHLGEMTDELLLFSQLDCSTMRIQSKEVSLIPWLMDVLEDFHWQEGPPCIVNETNEESLVVSIDSYYLSRAMTNLLTNARRYSKSKIEIHVDKNQDGVSIHVDDDGPGVPEAERTNILKPFVRLDESRSAKTGGYGMGLAIVQKILHFHNGEVLVAQSALGGARVTLRWK